MGGQVRSWNFSTGETETLRVFSESNYITDVVMGINDHLFAGSSEGQLAIVSGDFKRRAEINAGIKSGIRSVAIGFDPSKLLVSTDGHKVHILDLEKESIIDEKSFEGHTDIITDLFAFDDKPEFITSFNY